MRIDWLSFFIGLFTAILIWFLFRIAKQNFLHAQAAIKQRLQEAKKGSLSSLEMLIREEAHKRAQGYHSTGIIFQLDEILITPRLLAPPPFLLAKNDLAPLKSITNMIIPYTPDFSDLASSYNVHKLTIPQSLQNGVNIMLVGEPGEGKSVALAYLASIVSLQSPLAGHLAEALPIFLHISDIDHQITAGQDPLENVILALMRKVQIKDKKGLSSLVQDAIQDKRALFILDGLDELSPSHLDKAAAFLQILISRYPQLLVITTAGTNYWGGLAKLGFFPLSLAAWTEKDCGSFVHDWADKWTLRFSKDGGNGDARIDPQLIISWLTAEKKFLTPMEWTLLTWGAFTGDLTELTALQSMDAYVERVITTSSSRRFLEKLAAEMITREEAWLSLDHISQLRKEAATKGYSDEESMLYRLNLQTGPAENEPRGSGRSNKTILQDHVLSESLEKGLLYESANGTIGFSSPQIVAYLASFAYSLQDQPSVQELVWDTKAMALGFQAALTQRSAFIDRFLSHSHPPLHRILITLSRWLHFDSGKANWRKNLLHSMAAALNQPGIPAQTCARIMCTFLRSNDSNLPALFRQSLKSSNPQLRMLTALAVGAIRENRLFSPVVNLLSDPVAEVRYAACMTLSRLDHPQKESVFKEIFTNGDEEMQQALAESLVCYSDEDLEYVKVFLKGQDLLNRRAAILALGHIREDWTKELIESISIRDGQWMVRSAAAQVFEFINNPIHPLAPLPLPAIHENPEMIVFASKQGVGLSIDQDYDEILQKSLETGSPEQQQVALQYLQKAYRHENADNISKLMTASQNAVVKNAACNALWNMEITSSWGKYS